MPRQTKYAMAVWCSETENPPAFYAFPLGALKPWDDVPTPFLNDPAWSEHGTLPQGQVVTDEVAKAGTTRVGCKIAGVPMFTAAWAIEDSPSG
jgi:hypothetical protein